MFSPLPGVKWVWHDRQWKILSECWCERLTGCSTQYASLEFEMVLNELRLFDILLSSNTWCTLAKTALSQMFSPLPDSERSCLNVGNEWGLSGFISLFLMKRDFQRKMNFMSFFSIQSPQAKLHCVLMVGLDRMQASCTHYRHLGIAVSTTVSILSFCLIQNNDKFQWENKTWL